MPALKIPRPESEPIDQRTLRFKKEWIDYWDSVGLATGSPSSLAQGKIWIGDAASVATQRTVSGDATLSSVGVLTIASQAITFGKMQNIATDTLIGRDTAGTGSPESITLNSTLSMTGAGALQRAALTGDVTASAGSNATTIANDAVTYAKIQNVTDARLLGRSAGSSGDAQEITVGSGLSLSAGALTATGTATDSFKTIAVSGQSDIVADSSTDTLTIVAGSNVTLTTNAGTDTLTIAAAASGMASGTSNPGSPSTGDQFFRTDLGLAIYYDGTRWLTQTQYQIPMTRYQSTPPATPFGASQAYVNIGGSIYAPTYDIWMETFCWDAFVSTTNDATKYWDLALKSQVANASETTIVTGTTSTTTFNVNIPGRTAIGALAGTTACIFGVSVSKISTAGGLTLFSTYIVGRLVIT